MDEVDQLMKKYDDDEAHKAYLQSDEFKEIQKKKKEAEEQEEMQKTEELQTTLNDLEAQKAQGNRLVGTKQLSFAQDDEFLQELINDYSKDGANGIKILTKD